MGMGEEKCVASLRPLLPVARIDPPRDDRTADVDNARVIVAHASVVAAYGRTERTCGGDRCT
jgi:hypothetical protein